MLTVSGMQLHRASQVRLCRGLCTMFQRAADREMRKLLLPDSHWLALRSRLVAEAKADDEPE